MLDLSNKNLESSIQHSCQGSTGYTVGSFLAGSGYSLQQKTEQLLFDWENRENGGLDREPWS